jgi:hypothetical protein
MLSGVTTDRGWYAVGVSPASANFGETETWSVTATGSLVYTIPSAWGVSSTDWMSEHPRMKAHARSVSLRSYATFGSARRSLFGQERA